MSTVDEKIPRHWCWCRDRNPACCLNHLHLQCKQTNPKINMKGGGGGGGCKKEKNKMKYILGNMLLRPTALISPWIEGQLTPPKIPQECECWDSTRFQWKKLCEMTTSQCAYLVSTRKGYAGVHQCQGEGKKSNTQHLYRHYLCWLVAHWKPAR